MASILDMEIFYNIRYTMYKNRSISGGGIIQSPKHPNISFLHHTQDISPPSITYQSCRNCSNSPRDTLSLEDQGDPKYGPKTQPARFWQSQHYIQIKRNKSNLAPHPCIRPRKEEQKEKRKKTPLRCTAGFSALHIHSHRHWTQRNRTEQICRRSRSEGNEEFFAPGHQWMSMRVRVYVQTM